MKRGSKRNDRLSDLSDCVILHILSFLNTKQALQTCILSTRWRNVTKLLPTLRLYSSLHSKYLHNFANLVSQVLSIRDHSQTLHTLEFTDITDFIRPNLLKRIVEYAASHDIQLLKISITCDLQQFPPCLFSSQTLTSLDLCVHPYVINSKIFPNSLNFPALTTLTLRSFYFCARDNGYAEPFSAFSKLITLIIQDCKLLNARILCISSITLVNLTVDEIGYYRDSYICRLYTPNLYNLNYIGTLNQKLFRSCCFKHVYIDVRNECSRIFEQDYPFLLNLLVELGNIKSLTISFSTLQVCFMSCFLNLFISTFGRKCMTDSSILHSTGSLFCSWFIQG
jgi:hypothetical protein